MTDRETIIALRKEGVGPREIARRLGVTPGTVAGALNRAGMCNKANARAPRGAEAGSAKLTELEVRTIRLLAPKMSQRSLAETFGVGQSTISKIVRREYWTHVQ